MWGVCIHTHTHTDYKGKCNCTIYIYPAFASYFGGLSILADIFANITL